MDNLELKWGEQYPIVIKSWRDNWEEMLWYIAALIIIPAIGVIIYRIKH
jgi:transposase-like protein